LIDGLPIDDSSGFGRDKLITIRGLKRQSLVRAKKMKTSMTCDNIQARLASFGRVVAALVLVSCASAAILPGLTVVSGATTSSSTTTVRFVVSTDKPNYTGSATITVTGVAPPSATAVTVRIDNPARVAIVAVPATVHQDDTFSTTFQAGGGLWNLSGKYTVVAIVQQQDTVAAPPTTNSTFFYTAVATTTSASSISSNTDQGGPSSVASILGVVGFIVAAAALVGFMLRSRGRGRAATNTAAGAPKARGS
jgi:hypothetical protein